MTVIERAKILLGIEDDLQDNLLKVIQDSTEAHFMAYVGINRIPQRFDYIIVEVIVKRFNRLGSEGLASQSVEGLNMTFSADDFAEYDKVLKRFYAGHFDAGFKML